MKYTEHIFNQSPWLINWEEIQNDPHLIKLQSEKFIWRNTNFLDDKFPAGVFVLTGMRQIGKTTHLKMLIQEKINQNNHKNFFYFNCDLFDNKKEIVEIVEFYLHEIANQNKKIYLILDEITAVKDGILAIKYLIDRGYQKNIVYILSGSSSVNFKKTGEYLPGRREQGKDFIFHPLTFAENIQLKFPDKYQKIKQIIKTETSLELINQKIKKIINLSAELEKYLITGGIPKIINTFEKFQKIPPEQFRSYLSWIKSEIAKNQKNEFFIKIILERIFQSLSSDLSYNSIAQESGIGSHNTIYTYLNFLEDSFIIQQLYNYDFSQKKIQRKKNKKIYFNDPFVYWLISFWLKLGKIPSLQDLDDTVIKSQLIENIVANFLRQKFSTELFFYKTKYEIDFLTEKNAWEVKYQNQITSDDLQKIKKFPGQKIIISKNTLQTDSQNKLKIIPIELFLIL